MAATHDSQTFVIDADQATSAGFCQMGLMFDAALGIAGLVQTSDTGQIDFSTADIGTPTSNTNYGYQIWRMDDALQSTNPIFLKLTFGYSNTTQGTTRFRVYITVGTGSDGSGALTGEPAGQTAPYHVFPGTVSSGSHRVVGAQTDSGGWFSVKYAAGNANNWAFYIERPVWLSTFQPIEDVVLISFEGSQYNSTSTSASNMWRSRLYDLSIPLGHAFAWAQESASLPPFKLPVEGDLTPYVYNGTYRFWPMRYWVRGDMAVGRSMLGGGWTTGSPLYADGNFVSVEHYDGVTRNYISDVVVGGSDLARLLEW